MHNDRATASTINPLICPDATAGTLQNCALVLGQLRDALLDTNPDGDPRVSVLNSILCALAFEEGAQTV